MDIYAFSILKANAPSLSAAWLQHNSLAPWRQPSSTCFTIPGVSKGSLASQPLPNLLLLPSAPYNSGESIRKVIQPQNPLSAEAVPCYIYTHTNSQCSGVRWSELGHATFLKVRVLSSLPEAEKWLCEQGTCPSLVNCPHLQVFLPHLSALLCLSLSLSGDFWMTLGLGLALPHLCPSAPLPPSSLVPASGILPLPHFPHPGSHPFLPSESTPLSPRLHLLAALRQGSLEESHGADVSPGRRAPPLHLPSLNEVGSGLKVPGLISSGWKSMMRPRGSPSHAYAKSTERRLPPQPRHLTLAVHCF